MLNNNNLPESILNFIRTQSIFTLATSAENTPHCAICFYAYSEKLNALIFKSDRQSRHVVEGINNKNVAVAISPSKIEISKIKGAQIEGTFIEPDAEQLKEGRQNYYKTFPFAIAFAGDIWLIELNKIKFVDNTIGFAKKINWERKTDLI